MDMSDPRIQKAFDWLMQENGENFLPSDEHSPTRDIFQVRLDRMSREMEKNPSLKDNSFILAYEDCDEEIR